MSSEFFLAFRYLKNKNKFFFNFGNMLSLIGVIIGIIAIFLVSSVLSGLEEEISKRFISSKSEIEIYKKDYSVIKDYDELYSNLKSNFPDYDFAAVTSGELILKYKKNITVSRVIAGNLAQLKKVTSNVSDIVIGQPTADNFDNGIILGMSLAINLGVTVGEDIQIIHPIAKRFTPFGKMPKTKILRVVGIFNSKIQEVEQTFSYIALDSGYDFFYNDKVVERIEVLTKNHKTQEAKKRIENFLGENYQIMTWYERDRSLFNAMRMERYLIITALFMIIMISASNMIGNLIKTISEKKKEIGILKAIGMDDQDIKKIFINCTLIISVMGILIGTVFSSIFILIQEHFHFIKIPIQGYQLDFLPMKFNFWDFIIYPLLTILTMYIGTLLPIKKVSQINLIRLIREG